MNNPDNYLPQVGENVFVCQQIQSFLFSCRDSAVFTVYISEAVYDFKTPKTLKKCYSNEGKHNKNFIGVRNKK